MTRQETMEEVQLIYECCLKKNNRYSKITQVNSTIIILSQRYMYCDTLVKYVCIVKI